MPVLLEALKTLPLRPAENPTPQQVLPMLPRSDRHREDKADLPLQIRQQLLEVMQPRLVNPTPQQVLRMLQRSDHHRADQVELPVQVGGKLREVVNPLLVNQMPQQLPPSPPPWLAPTTRFKPDKSIPAVFPATPQSASLPSRPPALPIPRQWTISLL